jgi:hypothetical protein
MLMLMLISGVWHCVLCAQYRRRRVDVVEVTPADVETQPSLVYVEPAAADTTAAAAPAADAAAAAAGHAEGSTDAEGKTEAGAEERKEEVATAAEGAVSVQVRGK